MRILSLTLVIACFCMGLMAQEAQYESGLLVLRDGRVLAIRGDYEVYGDEVRFTDQNGKVMSLPFDKVDLNETDRRNQILREKNRKAQTEANQSEALVDQVERWQRDNPQSQDETPKFYRETKADEVLANQDIPRQLAPYEDELKQVFEWVDRRVNTTSRGFVISMYVFLGVMVLAGLVSFITQILLLLKSYQESGWWFAALFIGMFGPLISLIASCFGQNLFFVVSLISTIFAIVLPILLVVFIVLYCEGSRLRYFLCWLAPMVVALVGGFLFGLFLAFA